MLHGLRNDENEVVLGSDSDHSLTRRERLIAIMLGRLEMDLDQCIAEYSQLAEEVFGEKKRRFPFNLKGKTKSRFDSAKLETAIQGVIKRSGLSNTTLLNDESERGCKT